MHMAVKYVIYYRTLKYFMPVIQNNNPTKSPFPKKITHKSTTTQQHSSEGTITHPDTV